MRFIVELFKEKDWVDWMGGQLYFNTPKRAIKNMRYAHVIIVNHRNLEAMIFESEVGEWIVLPPIAVRSLDFRAGDVCTVELG